MKLYDVRFYDKSDKQWYYLDEAKDLEYNQAFNYYSQLNKSSSIRTTNGYYFIFPSDTRLNFMLDFMENITFVEDR